MRARRSLFSLLAFILAFALAHTSAWAAERRVALLVANQAYAAGGLSYPAQDVAQIRAALLAIGFRNEDVMVLGNADQKQMKRALSEFGRRAAGAEVAFLYYSGHATQALGQNWLIPIGADIRNEADYELEAVSAQAALTQLQASSPGLSVVVLDACRDNPVAVNKSGTKGLARMDAGSATVLAFATAPNRTAADNGLYARVLAAELTKKQEVLDVFRNAGTEVRRVTRNEQAPRVGEVDLPRRFYLAGEPGASEVVVTQRPAPQLAAQPAPQPKPVPAAVACSYCPDTVVVPAGSFMMGSPANELGRDEDEGPIRRVTVVRFELGKYEVTQGQWKVVMGSNPSEFRSCGDDCPVENVSWNDAQEYIRKLNEKSGRNYRLPSEAEWEYAARAGSTTAYPWGVQASHEYANYGEDLCCGGLASGRDQWVKTAPVGRFAANAFGLHDMHGNVREWVQDVRQNTYAGAPTDGSAWTQGSDEAMRVLRGGTWNYSPQGLRSAFRNWEPPNKRDSETGFRIARTL